MSRFYTSIVSLHTAANKLTLSLFLIVCLCFRASSTFLCIALCIAHAKTRLQSLYDT